MRNADRLLTMKTAHLNNECSFTTYDRWKIVCTDEGRADQRNHRRTFAIDAHADENTRMPRNAF